MNLDTSISSDSSLSDEALCYKLMSGSLSDIPALDLCPTEKSVDNPTFCTCGLVMIVCNEGSHEMHMVKETGLDTVCFVNRNGKVFCDYDASNVHDLESVSIQKAVIAMYAGNELTDDQVFTKRPNYKSICLCGIAQVWCYSGLHELKCISEKTRMSETVALVPLDGSIFRNDAYTYVHYEEITASREASSSSEKVQQMSQLLQKDETPRYDQTPTAAHGDHFLPRWVGPVNAAEVRRREIREQRARQMDKLLEGILVPKNPSTPPPREMQSGSLDMSALSSVTPLRPTPTVSSPEASRSASTSSPEASRSTPTFPRQEAQASYQAPHQSHTPTTQSSIVYSDDEWG